jgi:flagellar assembly factor FliW
VVKIKTRNFGTMEVEEKQRITFNEGILGFEGYKEYYLIIKQDSPFLWLQSSENENLAFVLINPYLFMPDYNLSIGQKDWDLIQIEKDNDYLTFAIVTIPANPEDMTANLQGPVVINPKKRLGVQAISLDDRYFIKHPILPALKKVLATGEEK